MNYGNAIKKIREMKNIARMKLATDVGIASSYVALIETGKRVPSLPMLEDIARALGVPLPLLLLAGAEGDDLDGITPAQAEKLVKFGASLLEPDKEQNDE